MEPENEDRTKINLQVFICDEDPKPTCLEGESFEEVLQLRTDANDRNAEEFEDFLDWCEPEKDWNWEIVGPHAGDVTVCDDDIYEEYTDEIQLESICSVNAWANFLREVHNLGCAAAIEYAEGKEEDRVAFYQSKLAAHNAQCNPERSNNREAYINWAEDNGLWTCAFALK